MSAAFHGPGFETTWAIMCILSVPARLLSNARTEVPGSWAHSGAARAPVATMKSAERCLISQPSKANVSRRWPGRSRQPWRCHQRNLILHPDRPFAQYSTVDAAPSAMKLLGDARKVLVEKRSANRLARRCVRRNLDFDFAHCEP